MPRPPQNNVISFDLQYILASIFKLAILLNLNTSMVVCCQQRLPNKRIFQKTTKHLNTSPYKLLTAQHCLLFVYFISTVRCSIPPPTRRSIHPSIHPSIQSTYSTMVLHLSLMWYFFGLNDIRSEIISDCWPIVQYSKIRSR